MLFCVGRYPCCSNMGIKTSGSSIIVRSSHANSLFCDVSGILKIQPPIKVDVFVEFELLGTGNMGIIPIFPLMYSIHSLEIVLISMTLQALQQIFCLQILDPRND